MRVESAHLLAGAEVLAFLEDAVRRQVELAVHVNELAVLEIGSAVVRVEPGPALAEPDEHSHRPGLLR